MLENLNNSNFEYQRLSPEEMTKRGILGRLVGPIADFKNPTRNDRLYSEELWENVFEDPIMKEKLENRCVFGELGHPVDRTEIDMEKIAVCLAEKPKKSNGKLIGIFDILNTPNGKILKTMCDYGCTVGISSRGQGDVVEDFDGNGPKVDPSTYQCECWDVVLVPGMKEARLKYVTESLNNKTLKQALNEQLEKASTDDKKIMQETLNNLNIEYTPEEVIDKSDEAANNVGATMVKELQDSLLANRALENKITELQEKLSVCYAKEAKYDEDIAKYKTAIRNLSESVSNGKTLQIKLNSLTEQLKEKDLEIEKEKSKYLKLTEKQDISISRERKLNESISQKATEVTNANNKIKELNENLISLKESFENEKQLLQEDLAEAKKNLAIKTTEYNTKLSKSNSLIEQYRNNTKLAVNKYIECRANMLGVTPEEVKNKLPENYSFADIDTICENLSDYKLNVSKLPFNLQKDTKVAIKESKQSIMPQRLDDTVDESLLNLARLKY